MCRLRISIIHSNATHPFQTMAICKRKRDEDSDDILAGTEDEQDDLSDELQKSNDTNMSEKETVNHAVGTQPAAVGNKIPSSRRAINAHIDRIMRKVMNGGDKYKVLEMLDHLKNAPLLKQGRRTRAPTPYNMFVKETMPEVINITDIKLRMKKIAELWKLKKGNHDMAEATQAGHVE